MSKADSSLTPYERAVIAKLDKAVEVLAAIHDVLRLIGVLNLGFAIYIAARFFGFVP